MMIDGTEIADTFAEAFPMTATRLIVTAETPEWAMIAARAATGHASSVIGCDCEAGIERIVETTPDGRPGVSLLFFSFSREALEKAVVNRVANDILTCAGTAVFAGMQNDKPIRLGSALRYFGDGNQIAKQFRKTKYWRIPVMDGEFLIEDSVGTFKGVAGGNLILLGESQMITLKAAQAAVAAIDAARLDVILPFPGGIVRSGSKVGSKYAALKASTNEAYCPTLRGLVPSELPEGVHCAYEIVIDGLTYDAVANAMRVGMQAACIPGVRRISAGNYGGKLGPHHFKLRELAGPA